MLHKLILSLKEQGVELWVEDQQRLRFRAKPGAMTPEIRSWLKANKPDIIAALNEAYSVSGQTREAIRHAPGAEAPSFAQERLWFVEQLQDGAPVYLMPETFRITQALDADKLEAAFRLLIRRQQSLRTGFVQVGGRPRLHIVDQPQWSLQREDLGGHSAVEREAICRDRIEAFVRKPFHLDQPPLMRALLVRLDDEHYVLAHVSHHLITDGWSSQIFNHEWIAAYLHENEARLPALSINYADYAHWQREILTDEIFDNQTRFWRNRLQHVSPLDLPTDRPRPRRQDWRGAVHRFVIDAETTAGLKRLAREEEATLFMVLLAGVQTWAYRTTNQDDFAIGVSTGAREAPELEHLVGLFVNLLALPAAVAPMLSFRELIRSLREHVLQAFQNQDLPFEKVVEACRPEREPGRHPLFQIQMMLEPALGEPRDLGLAIQPYIAASVVARMDLTFGFSERADDLIGGVEYAVSLFDHATAESMSRRLLRLLADAVAHPDTPLVSLDFIGAEALRRLQTWQNDAFVALGDLSLGQRFEAVVRAHGDARALESGDVVWTYDELYRRASNVAAALQMRGVTPDSTVGVLCHPEPEAVAALLGVIMAGGAYVPLDPDDPVERLGFILGDTGMQVLISRDELLDVLPAFQLNFMQILTLEEVDDFGPPEPTVLDLENLAYVMYTSGTTGRPKGVCITHANVLRLVVDDVYVRITCEDRVAQTANFCFDALTFELWATFLNGACLVMTPKDLLLDETRFRKQLERHPVSVMFMTTPLFNILGKNQPDLFLGMKTLLAGGDRLDPDAARALRALPEAPRFLNCYGPTESTTFATWHEVMDVDGDVPIGIPLRNTRCHVVDSYVQPVAPGIYGELCLAGDGLGRAYFGRPGLTAERFLPNPFGDREGDRLYRTGDRVRLHQGRIWFVGRLDHQVKIRGFRIEPGEIETALCEHEQVEEAVVMLATEGEKRLIAYPRVTGVVDAELVRDLRNHLVTSLPTYMLPSEYVPVTRYPLTPNGKVDRKALARQNLTLASSEAQRQPPRNEGERRMAAIWQEVLRLEQIGVHDNFFEMGGDSLRALQIKAQSKIIDLDFELNMLFEHPTVATLLEALGDHEGVSAEGRAEVDAFAMIDEEDRQRMPSHVLDAYPLSRLQMGMLFHGDYDVDETTYHDLLFYRLTLPCDPEALGKTMEYMAARHEVFRTSFDLSTYQRPLQMVWATAQIPVIYRDLREEPDSEAYLTEWLQQEIRTPFQWEQAPLFRVFAHQLTHETFQLSFSFHHAILDGWSEGLLFTELLHLYTSLRQQITPEEEKPSASYRDFIQLERDALQSAESQAFWREHLQNYTLHALPILDKPEPDDFQHEIFLPLPLCKSLHETAAAMGVSLKAVLLTAYLKTIAVLTGQDEVITGLIENGRPETLDGERILGLFLNTVPIRMSLTSETWRELITRVFATMTAIMPHRRYPLADIVKNLGGGAPFETAFNFTHFHEHGALETGDFTDVVTQWGGHAKPNFPFSINLSQKPGSKQLVCYVNFDSDRFARSRITEIATYFGRLLHALVEDLDHPHRRSYLIDADYDRLAIWNDTLVATEPGENLDRCFQSWAEVRKQGWAIVDPHRRLRYGELAERTEQVAAFLDAQGLRPGQVVGLLAPRSCEMAVIFWACLKTGLVYAPFDPDYPVDRLAFMIEDAEPALVFHDPGRGRLRDGPDWVALDDPRLNETPTGYQSRTLPLNSPAYLIYTSGSTGRPKGSLIPRAGLMNLVHAFAETYEITPSDRVIQMASASFDACLSELICALGCGATVYVCPRDVMGADLFRFLQERHISILTITPSALAALPRRPLPHLRVVMSMGEACGPELVEHWGQGRRFFNAYGPTEASIWSTVYRCGSGQGAPPPIGYPIRNVRLYVVDDHGVIVSVGAVGELWIDTAGLALGYLHRPGLTAERFVPDPFGESVGGRLYRSGDRVRFRRDGALDFLGRIDAQIKLRGHRIEPGEIQAHIEADEGVRQAFVTLGKGADDTSVLHAYVQISGDVVKADVARNLRDALKQRLPEYMVPAAFIVLERFPLTPNGKIDVAALPTPDQIQNRDYQSPRTPVQEVLAGIFERVLDVPRVGLNDNFFELGGHSLLATQAVSRIRRTFRIPLPIRTLFDTTDIADLARHVEKMTAQGVMSPPIKAVALTAPPLSHAQERMWFLNRLEPDDVAYNIPVALHVDGKVRLDDLDRALRGLVQRHEVLRTRFPACDGRPIQEVAMAPAQVLRVRDVADESEARTLIDQDAALTFDLERGPLYRFLFFKIDDNHGVLYGLFHHIVFDGWSVSVFLDELIQNYAAFHHGRPSPLQPLDVQYKDYAVWQRDWLKGRVLKHHLDFWKTRIGLNPPWLDLPTDRPRPATQTRRGDVHNFRLPQALSQRLLQFSRDENATLFMTGLAAFQTLLHRFSGQNQILVGSPIANRNHPEIEGLIGFFVNTLVLRADFDADPSFRQLTAQMRDFAVEAYAFQDLPFEKLVEVLEPERDLSRSPLFQVVFAVQNQPQPEVSPPDLSLRLFPLARNTSKFDMSLFLFEDEDGLQGQIEFNLDLFDRNTIARLIGVYQVLLEAVLAQPDIPLSRISLLDEATRERLSQWGDPSVAIPAGSHLDRYDQKVAANGDTVVVIAQSEVSLTYQQLDRCADRLAAAIQMRLDGVSAPVIATFLPRGLDFVIAMVAVAKMGGVFVALDTSFPTGRLHQILVDCEAKLLLCDHELDGFDTPTLNVSDLPSSTQSVRTPEWGPQQPVAIIYKARDEAEVRGVVLTKCGLMQLISARVGSPCARMHLAPLSVLVSYEEIWSSLIRGDVLYVADDVLRRNPEKLAEFINRHDIEQIAMPPFALLHLVRHLQTDDLASVRQVDVVGEPPRLSESLRRFLHGRRLTSCYTPSEAPMSVLAEFRDDAAQWSSRPAMGRPLRHLVVMERCLEPAPIGAPGRLAISGEHLGWGYFGKPRVTATLFVPNPVPRFDAQGAPLAGDRIFLSGDMARWSPDGELMHMGELNELIRIRGRRIEPVIIESVIEGHPAVDECAIFAEYHAQRPQLTACVILHRGRAVSAAELRNWLKDRAPDFLTPAYFVFPKTFPVNGIGRLDRQELAEMVHRDRRRAVGQGVKDRGRSRDVIVDLLGLIWCDLLQVEDVTPEDHFFALGGHSLMATRLIARIRDRLNVELPVKDIFKHPTLAALATHIDHLRRLDEPIDAPPLEATDGEPVLSFAQERLWFLVQLEGDSHTYNLPLSLALTGPLNIDALNQSVQALFFRHETLRSNIIDEEGRPRLIIREPDLSPMPVIDLSGHQDPTGEAHRLIQQHALRIFDLAADPLCDIGLIRLDEEDHILLINMHHIISDGWSTSIFVSELLGDFRAFRDGLAVAQSPPVLRYRDYAAWQRRCLSGEVLDARIAYWRAQLTDLTPLELPTDRPRPAVMTFRSEVVTGVFGEQLTQDLLQLSRQHGGSLFMTLLAAFQLLLGRLAGQDDVAVGAPIAGRTHGELESLIGFFINTIVLRTDLSGDPTFTQLADRVQASALDAHDHQDLPFAKLVQVLEPERDLSRNPLFQVFFNMINLPMPVLDEDELRADLIGSAEIGAKFDLTLYIVETDHRIRMEWVYNADLFDRDRIQIMVEQYRALLLQIVADPERSIDAYHLIAPETAHVLPDLHEPLPTAWPGSVSTLIREQVARMPEAMAVAGDGFRLTYAELMQRADQVADYLRNHGVRRGDTVAIFAERSPLLPLAVLGVLNAGAAFFILDPEYPLHRVTDMLETGRPAGFIRLEDADPLVRPLKALLAHVPCRLVLTRAVAAELAAYGEPPTVNIGPDDLAFLSFTSGTTGRPKVIEGRHGPLTQFLSFQVERFDIGAQAYAMLSGLSHDPLQRDIFTSLCLGGVLHVPHSDEFSPGRLASWLALHGVEIIHLTPALAKILAEAPRSLRLRHLRRIFLTGEALTGDVVHMLRRIAPQAQVINLYGATETQRAVGFDVVKDESARIPLGMGMPGLQLFVLNRGEGQAGVGELGEIVFRSPHMARGYRDSELTAMRFTPNPAGGLSGERIYRTGDLGRHLPDGRLVFVGRRDGQIKVRGYRVEVAEIQIRLTQHPQVQAAVLMQRSDWEDQLVAFLTVVDPSDPPRPQTLRAHLTETLPVYMIPAAWVILDALPLTANRKIDLHALAVHPLDEAARAGAARLMVAPHTPTQQLVAELFCELLDLDDIGLHADFFDLGGHSLLAARAVARLRKDLGVSLSLRQFFAVATVAGLAEAVDAMRGGPDIADAIPRRQDHDIPLSHVQIRPWRLHQERGPNAIYNLPIALRLRGHLRVDLLGRAFDTLVYRHETLRTRFGVHEDRPLVEIMPFESEPLPIIDLRQLPDPEGEAVRIIYREEARSFHIDSEPLLRRRLLWLDTQDWLLLINIHHIISDGWSNAVLMAELSDHYTALARDEAPPHKPMPIQYADYAAWERTWLRGQVYENLQSWWKNYLTDAPSKLALPYDHHPTGERRFLGATKLFHFDQTTTQRLRAFSRKQGATLFMTLLAAFKLMLAQRTGQRDIVVGALYANRSHPEVEHLIGLFVNVIFLRTKLPEDVNLARATGLVKQSALGAFAKGAMPYPEIIKAVTSEPDPAEPPTLQVIFALQNVPRSKPNLPGLELSPGPYRRTTSKVDLSLTVSEVPEGLLVAFEYDTERFNESTIQTMAKDYDDLLERLLDV